MPGSLRPPASDSSRNRIRRDLHEIVQAGIKGADPERLVLRALEREEGQQRIRVLSAGKAAVAMAAAASRVLGSRIVEGLIVCTEPAEVAAPFTLIAGGHPLPTVESERAGRRALALVESVQPGERFLCLLSGGASALMAVPAAGISLDDKKATTGRLLQAGADITALNCVRKHLSDVKGGGLALRSASGCHTLAISDVVGDDLAVIGSGPGVPDASSFADAIEILRQFGGHDAYPSTVLERLRAGAGGDLTETLKPSDPRAGRATASVIGGRMNAMDGACAAADGLGYHVVRIDRPVIGEAREAARELLWEIAMRTGPFDVPVCVVSSGETTVHVTGSGKGGRNQEFALAAVGDLSAFEANVALASVGTDGIDGPTGAAGAFVDNGTLERGRQLGLDPAEFLAGNDSNRFFETLGDLVVTGPTGTNVGDLQVFLRE
jgi:glycerate 2-kinase